MGTVGVRALRLELAAWLDKAADGEPVTITRHGRPTAVLDRYDDEERTSDEHDDE
jgi:prevent-host-death family protein